MIKYLLSMFGFDDKTSQRRTELLNQLLSDSINKSRFKNISEPVLSFVKTFEENPKRFKYESVYKPFSPNFIYYFKDLKLNITYRIYIPRQEHHSFLTIFDTDRNLDWLTHDEKDYLYTTIHDYYSKRRNRYNDLRKQREKRSNIHNREKYIKMYCENPV